MLGQVATPNAQRPKKVLLKFRGPERSEGAAIEIGQRTRHAVMVALLCADVAGGGGGGGVRQLTRLRHSIAHSISLLSLDAGGVSNDPCKCSHPPYFFSTTQSVVQHLSLTSLSPAL